MSPGSSVVSLRADYVPGEPSKQVIKLLEDLLDEARRGEIVSFAATTVSPVGFVGRATATSGTPHAHHLVAGCSYLLRMVQDQVVDGD